jgi:hypothetical protein
MDRWTVLLFAGTIGEVKLAAKEKQQEMTKRNGSNTIAALGHMLLYCTTRGLRKKQ